MASLLLRAGAVALTLSACADAPLDPPTVNATATSDAGTAIVDPLPPPASGLRVLTTTADGAAASVFDAEDAVHIVTDSVNAEGDYYFDVIAFVHPPGDPTDLAHLSEDGPGCRRFHVGASGHIDNVYTSYDANGARCDHAVAGDQAGGLALHLMPFDTSAGPIVERDANGNRVYRVRVARVGNDLTANAADSSLFYVAPPPPVCGNGILENGEQCDDGNLVCGDGCSSECAPD